MALDPIAEASIRQTIEQEKSNVAVYDERLQEAQAIKDTFTAKKAEALATIEALEKLLPPPTPVATSVVL